MIMKIWSSMTQLLWNIMNQAPGASRNRLKYTTVEYFSNMILYVITYNLTCYYFDVSFLKFIWDF